MIDGSFVGELIAQYEKHGWKLRRVLLSDRMRESLAGTIGVFADADIVVAEIDALWFSRKSREDIETWELRHLSKAAYAIVTSVAATAESNEIDEALDKAEATMLAKVSARNRS